MSHYKKKAILFLLSQGITLFGSSLVQFAIIWFVTLHTTSGTWVFALTVASCVPQFIISFFSGVWADRYSKKRLIIFSDGIIALTTLLFVLIMPYVGEGLPFLLALILISIIRSLGAGVQSPAVNSAIPSLVPQEQLMKFNGINSTIQSLIQFASPAAAGALLSLASFRITLMIDIITAIIGIGILLAVAIPFKKVDAGTSIFTEMKQGYQYALKERFVGKLLLIFGTFIFLCVPAGFLATLFVTRYYGNTYWYLTLIEVIGFLGMTAGGLLMGTWGGFKNRITTLVTGIIAFGILAVLMGAVDSFIIYLILMAVYGVAVTMVQTASTTLLQEKTVIEMQGRVFGLFGAMYTGFLPVGMAVFGPLADVVSMRLLMIISGVLLISLSVIIIFDKTFHLQRDNNKLNIESEEVPCQTEI